MKKISKICLFACCAVILPTTSMAGNLATLGDIASLKSNEAHQDIANSLGLNLKEFENRREIISRVTSSLPSSLESRLESEPKFAGTWVEHQPKPVMIVAFAGSNGYERGKKLVAQIASELGGIWAEYVEVRQAAISVTELSALRDKFDMGFKKLGIATNSGITYIDPHVLYHVTQPVDAVVEQLRKLGIQPSSFVRFKEVSQLDSLYVNLYGGIGVANVLNGASQCTTGFSVTNIAGTVRGITTAGHCNNNIFTNGDGTVSRPLTYVTGLYNGSYDIQWHTVPTTLTVTNLIKGEGTRRVNSIKTYSAQKIGDIICKSGMRTNVTCGTLKYKDWSHTDPAMPGFGVRTYGRVDCNTMASCAIPLASPGDSGAPVYSRSTTTATAYGSLVGGAGPTILGSDYFVYMPIDNISAIGVKVLTVP